MKVRRDVGSVPKRSAAETWTVIKELITAKDSKHVSDLDAVAGVMGSIIADEHPAKAAFVLHGVGPRLIIYCQYGADALTEDENIGALNWNPTAGDWHLEVPCDQENLAWVQKALAKKSARVRAYDVEKPEDESVDKVAATSSIEIDWTAGGQP